MAGLQGGSTPSDLPDEDRPQNVASRRPRRATAVAASLRIQGRLERAGIVHDRKAYMKSLSSAVTLAQAQEQQQPAKRTRDAKRHDAHNALDEVRDSEATCQLQQGTNAHAVIDLGQRADTYGTSLSQPSIPGADLEFCAGTTSALVHAADQSDRPKNKDQSKASPLWSRHEGVRKKTGPPDRQKFSSARTLAKPPPNPGAKLVPSRMRQVYKDTSPQDAGSEIPEWSQGTEWSDLEVKRLMHICARKVRPDSSNFWVKVSQKMPGRTVCQCFEKYFEAQKTPPRSKRPTPTCPLDTKLSLMGNDRCLTAAKKKKVARNLRWELQAMQRGSDVSDLPEKMKRQQRVDAFIDSYKRKRQTPATQAGAGSCGDLVLRSLPASHSPDTGAFVDPDDNDVDIGTSEQAIAALKTLHNAEVINRLKDTPERDWYFGESGTDVSE